jgi:RNA polymerase sigma factor (sigma-70 family)
VDNGENQMLGHVRTAAEVQGTRSNSTETNETRLIGLITAGDRYAFENLYRNYFPRLARFLTRMTRQLPLIEEIVNDTMLVVWQKSHTYDASSKVSTWIFAIAYRKALKATRSFDEPVDSDLDQCPGDPSGDPENLCSQKQESRMVGRALDALSIEQRTVVNLTYFHGMGYSEIAEIMECPVNTVKTRMFHARHRLKVILSGSMERVQ